MKRILIIENVNYIDYPTGGIMNFYRNMMQAFGDELMLAGISTDEETPIGKWSKKEINGTVYDFYSMARVTERTKKPIVPERIKNCIHVKRHIKNILSRGDFDVIFTHTPEVMLFIPDEYMNITCNCLPGVENPLSIARYPWARKFAGLYDRFILMPKAAKAKWLIAAADYNDRLAFAERSKGKISVEKVIEFPTRYDDNIYGVNRIENDNNETVIVTVGRLGWFKGWKLMIDAFKLASKELNNAKLYFIGDGEDHDKITTYIQEQGLDGQVVLLGKKAPKEIAEWLNKADLFVMGSMAEGWSTTLVEACACGVPCVVTDFSSAREMIADGKNGYVITGRDENMFADKMIEALTLDRNEVISYDKRFERLAVSHLKEDLNKIWS